MNVYDRTNQQLVMGILFVVMLAADCGRPGDSALSRPHRSPDRYRIAPLPTSSGLAGRSVIECPTGPCVVLHFPPYEMDPDESRQMDEYVARLLTGDPSTTADDGEWYRDEQGRWYAGTDGELMLSTFNCCTFAVGDALELTADDWIMPLKCGQAEDTFPMQVVLNSYFELVRHYRVQDVPFDCVRIESDTDLRQDDVLCFVQTLLSNGVSARIIHAGRIRKHDGRNWLVSKIGSGPILVTPIETLVREYDGTFDVVQIHRLKVPGG